MKLARDGEPADQIAAVVPIGVAFPSARPRLGEGLRRSVAVVPPLALAIVLPLVLNDYYLYLATQVAIYAIATCVAR